MTRPAFLFIRHGETDWNADGRLQGQHDVPLNALGRAQSAEAGRRAAAALRAAGVEPEQARFVVSPLGRTRDTAERARLAMGLPAGGYAEDERLKELSFGRWEGFTWPEIKVHEAGALRERRRDKWRFVPPGGESYEQLSIRIRPFIDSVTERLVVVSHGGVARVMMALIGGLPTVAAVDAPILQGRVLRFAAGGTAWL